MSMCHVCACCNRQTSRKACGSQSWVNVRSVAEAVGRVAATTSFPWPTASCPRPTAHSPQSLCAMLEMRHLGSGEDTRCRDGQRGLPPDRHAVIRLAGSWQGRYKAGNWLSRPSRPPWSPAMNHDVMACVPCVPPSTCYAACSNGAASGCGGRAAQVSSPGGHPCASWLWAMYVVFRSQALHAPLLSWHGRTSIVCMRLRREER
jgi:hypothetical protein